MKDARGRPIVVYHGTGNATFDTFSTSMQRSEGLKGPGFYFAQDPSMAGNYTDRQTTYFELSVTDGGAAIDPSEFSINVTVTRSI